MLEFLQIKQDCNASNIKFIMKMILQLILLLNLQVNNNKNLHKEEVQDHLEYLH